MGGRGPDSRCMFPQSLASGVRGSVEKPGSLAESVSVACGVYINHDTPLHLMQLLAVSGPFHYWGPVVDGQYLREAPARALQRAPRVKVDLLIGSSQDDGLINSPALNTVLRGGSRGGGTQDCGLAPPLDLCSLTGEARLSQRRVQKYVLGTLGGHPGHERAFKGGHSKKML